MTISTALKKRACGIVILSLIFVSFQPVLAASLIYESFDQDTLSSARWIETDASNHLDTTSIPGKLSMDGGENSWNSAKLYSQSTYSRVAGRSLIAQMQATVSASNTVFHFNPTQNPADPTISGYGIAAKNNYSFAAVTPNGNIEYDPLSGLGAHKSINYTLTTILRSTGSYHLISGGEYGTYPQATLIWVNDKGSDANVYAGVQHYSGNAWVDALKVRDLGGDFAQDFGLAQAGDSFSRVGDIDGSTLDIKNNQTWTAFEGSPTTDGTKGVFASNNRAVTTGVTDGIIEADMTSPGSGSFSAGLVFRYSDPNNYWFFTGRDNVYLIGYFDGGVFVQVDMTGATSFGNGQTKRLRVVLNGDRICPYADETQVLFGCYTNTFNNTASGAGVYSSSGDMIFDNFAVWPEKVTLPTGTSEVPTLPVAGSTTIASDTFTDGDGTNLTAHTMTQGSGWTTPLQTWTINSNTVSPGNDGAMAITETGITDMAASVDVTLPQAGEGDTEWYSGLLLRYTDANNFTFARFLWQTGSPEIEIWDVVNTVGTIINAVNITWYLDLNSTHTLTAAAIGTQISVYMDGTLYLQGTSSRTTGTKAGLVIGDGVSTPLATFDNFIVKNAVVDTMGPSAVVDVAAAESPTTSPPALSWSAVHDDSTPVDYYRVYRSSTPGALGTQVSTDGVVTGTTFTDAAATSGSYYYTVRAVDEYGNESTIDDNLQSSLVEFDNTPPTGSISINSAAAYTGSPNVTLTISGSDNRDDTPLIQMQVSNLSNFSDASWEAYSTTKSWTLSDSTTGTYTVYIRFKDSLDNTSSGFNDSITLDVTAPTGSIIINSGDVITFSSNVTLSLTASDTHSGVADMIISESGTFSGATWEAFATSKSFTLSSGIGTKTVYVKFRDEMDNESSTYQDDILSASVEGSSSTSSSSSSSSSSYTTTSSSAETTSQSSSSRTSSTSSSNGTVYRAGSGYRVLLIDDQTGLPLANVRVIIDELDLNLVTSSEGIAILGNVKTIKAYDARIDYNGSEVTLPFDLNEANVNGLLEVRVSPAASFNFAVLLIVVLIISLGAPLLWWLIAKRRDNNSEMNSNLLHY